MKRVLIVDDESFVLDDLERNVDWKGLEVGKLYRANSVASALQIYEKYEPDLILSDIEMTGENGVELLRRLREKGVEVPFLLLTCHPDFTYAQAALRLGIADYLLKPVDYEELYRAIERQLHGRDSTAGEEATEGLSHRAKSYIKEHLVSLEYVSEIADALHCSESTLNRTFKRDTGWSLAEYIVRKRIDNAEKLLRDTAWSVSMISDLCGFRDQAYFSRVFKKSTGLTPNEFRKQRR